MNIFNVILNFIQKRGFFKITLATLLFIILLIIYNNYWDNSIMVSLMIIPAAYVIIVFIIAFIYGIIGLIKDIKNK